MKRSTHSIFSLVKNVVAPWQHVIYALCIACGALVAFLSLLSYRTSDPSWFFYSSQPAACHNVLGVYGAQVAATCIYLFGAAAYLLPLLIFWYAWLVAHRQWNWQSADRIGASLLLVLTSAALCHRYTFGRALSGCCGGLVGYHVHTQLISLLDPTLATLIITAAHVCAFIVLFPHATWYAVCATARGCRFVYQHPELFARAYHAVAYAVWLASRPLVYAARYLLRLIDGTWLPEQDSVVLFEQDARNTAATPVTDDAFWRTYLQERVNANAQERAAQQTATQDTCRPAESTSTPALPATSGTRMYRLPHGTLLKSVAPKATAEKATPHEREKDARILEEKLKHFGLSGSVVAIKQGPVITSFEYKPDIDSRISKIVSLEDDLALALQATSIRIIAPIPGTSVIGIEVPNKTREAVCLFDLMQRQSFKQQTSALKIALGVDTIGNDVVVDLARMPHLLVAGSTGSGKSVALHTMLMSLLCTHTPESMRLVLVDPKRLEFAPYANIAHLLFPIINTPAQALPALSWVVREMEARYERMTEAGVRTISEFNTLAHQEDLETLPFIVVCIDELADLMMLAGKECEDLITRITQMARAAGIHLIVATQRPSVDVVTGLIKVNFPSRISFRISTKIDSRTIIDCAGAEKLLGNGDMLFLDSTDSLIKRIQGAYVAPIDIERIVQFIKNQREPAYQPLQEATPGTLLNNNAADEELFKLVIAYVQQLDEVSISLLQRRFRIGYNRSARMIDTLEARGFVGPADGQKLRKVIHRVGRIP